MEPEVNNGFCEHIEKIQNIRTWITRNKDEAEGLNGVNRQMGQKLTVNRQKRNIFSVNRQMNEPKLAVKFLRYP